jgi:DNA-binding XRE family transcriptional regulator
MAVRWWRKAKHKRKSRQVWKKPDLYIEEILSWADAWKARTGQWPKVASGRIRESLNDKWITINGALIKGYRGLPGGSSLVQLLAERRGVRNPKRLPRLRDSKILIWADAWKARTGSWPKRTSGRIPESPGDNWEGINNALHQGHRGLPGGSTLAQLLAKRRGVRDHMRLAPFEIPTILAWADGHYRRTGDWPQRNSGPIADAPGESWMAVEMALFHGARGLPGGATLARLLARERGRRAKRNLPVLSVKLILSWADAHIRLTGTWPRTGSGAIHNQPGEKWQGIENALRMGLRGLAAGSSLHQLLAAHGRIPRPQGLKRRRVEAGLSRRMLAEKMGVVLTALPTWEHGRSLPRSATLASLARTLRLPVAQLRAEMEAVRKSWRKKHGETARSAPGSR